LKKHVSAAIMIFFSTISLIILSFMIKKSGIQDLIGNGLALKLLFACAICIALGFGFDIIIRYKAANKNLVMVSVVYWGVAALASRLTATIKIVYVNDISPSLFVSVAAGLISIFALGCIFGFFFFRMYISVYEKL
jgi:hypothetical protein